eukprot:TRINITY_DN29010_c0_g1_i5.p1 TRINITY_DN29010_c0_g1~~TRINITY_DN29010_c0_g1_i5.p1  ORF type:complete len:363 (-),score=19.14 TRINITY_DN29010_c0_g1_i5:34-1122(-)
MLLIIDLKPQKILKSLDFLQNPWTFFGIKFAPIFMPIEDRICTLVIFIWTHTILFLALFTTIVMIYMLILTKYWWIALAYCAWVLFDKDTMNKGGRSGWLRERMRNWVFWKYFVRYFPIRLVKTANLDMNKNYVIGSHPHGICSAGAFGAFATEGAGFGANYPGISPYLHTLDMNCLGPLHREWILGLGCCSSSKKSISHVLSRPGGAASVLVVGGAAESIYSEEGRLRLVLKNRKGFIKLAMRHGADLVPSFSFGETGIYSQVSNLTGSFLRVFQDSVKQLTGVIPCLFKGRGFFQYSFGLMPLSNPITVVVGHPIKVIKNENPTNEEIHALHMSYMEELYQLYEAHKSKYGQKHINIEFV